MEKRLEKRAFPSRESIPGGLTPSQFTIAYIVYREKITVVVGGSWLGGSRRECSFCARELRTRGTNPTGKQQQFHRGERVI